MVAVAVAVMMMRLLWEGKKERVCVEFEFENEAHWPASQIAAAFSLIVYIQPFDRTQLMTITRQSSITFAVPSLSIYRFSTKFSSTPSLRRNLLFPIPPKYGCWRRRGGNTWERWPRDLWISQPLSSTYSDSLAPSVGAQAGTLDLMLHFPFTPKGGGFNRHFRLRLYSNSKIKANDRFCYDNSPCSPM